jgi:hypothetical protein
MEVRSGIGDHINVENPKTLRISAPGKVKSMEFVVVLVPLAEGEAVPQISSPAKGVVQIGADTLTFSPAGTKPPTRK